MWLLHRHRHGHGEMAVLADTATGGRRDDLGRQAHSGALQGSSRELLLLLLLLLATHSLAMALHLVLHLAHSVVSAAQRTFVRIFVTGVRGRA